MPDPATDWVLFLPKWYPEADSHNGNFIRNHAVAVALFHTVAVLYVGVKPQAALFTSTLEDDQGVLSLRVYYKKRITGISLLDKLLKMLLYFWGVYIGFRQLQQKLGKPSLLHAHVLLRPGVAAFLLSRLYKIPYLITEHRSDYIPMAGTYAGKSSLYKWLTKYITQKAACITAVSAYLQQAMESHQLHNTYHILPNVVDTDYFFPSSVLKPKNKIRIIHISTMADHTKNISGMLRAFKKLTELRDDIEVYMIGEWENNTHVLHYADQLGVLNTYVYFTGMKLGRELTALLQSGHFYVHFSNYETFGLAPAEAMACGLPVISTDVGCASSLITPETGKLIPVGDEASLLCALTLMCEQYANYDTSSILKQAEQFSYRKVGLNLHKLYCELLTPADKNTTTAIAHL